MSKTILYRTGRLRHPGRNRKRDVLHHIFTQATKACRQLLDRVDIDRKRNPVKNLPSLQPAPKELVAARKQIVREYKWPKVLAFLLKNKWQRVRYITYVNRKIDPPPLKSAFLFPRERLLSNSVLAVLIALPFTLLSTSADSNIRVTPVIESTIVATATTPTKPENWVVGSAELTGSKASVMGAYKYAQAAGYTFITNKDELDQLVATGKLVPLTGRYIELSGVSQPYVQPVVNRFANRLARQHAAVGCGKLVFTSALRTPDVQKKLPNRSNFSIHGTGMGTDLRRVIPDSREKVFCLNWLERTLRDIEVGRRIDATREKHPRHLHVAVVIHAYEQYLASLPEELDPEVDYLARGMYYEAPFYASEAEYTAIAWAIKNRARSTHYPNTILEVVAQGAAGRHSGKCQFTFMCDGKKENIQELCGHKPDLAALCEKRWAEMVERSKRLINSTEDPTGGATLYHATWMNPLPDWVVDMRPGTIRTVGKHRFACSKKRGSDVCAKGGKS